MWDGVLTVPAKLKYELMSGGRIAGFLNSCLHLSERVGESALIIRVAVLSLSHYL